MHKDVLIIGQGIAGTLLSAELLRQGKSVMVVDKPAVQQSSLVAAAVINPLIGKNWTVAKDTRVVIPAALDAYTQLEQQLHSPLLYQKSLLVFFRNEQEEAVFRRQTNIQNPYTSFHATTETPLFNSLRADGRPAGKIAPVYTVDAALLLQRWRQYLEGHASFREAQLDAGDLILGHGKARYKDICADKAVFCTGAAGRDTFFFPGLPFTANRGDTLLLSIPGLAADFLYQKGIRLVPRSDGLFWCGSNYTWQYRDLQADLGWQKQTLDFLNNWLKLPFALVDHRVAERPTTAGQLPILAQHEQWPQLFCFNGLGTRGFSAGPYLAKKMAAMIL